jgi:hypothetical protein
MTRHEGQCHCGGVKVTLESAIAADDLPLRACQCGFCRRHGAATTSHPETRLRIEARRGALGHYRFARRISDVLLCAECGVYVASSIEADGRRFATLNVRGVDLPEFRARIPEPAVYDDETDEQRLARRLSRWTPTELIEAEASA